MIRNITLCVLLLLNGVALQAQQYNQRSEFIKANSVWTFGEKAGLDFNSGTPTPFVSEYNETASFNESGCSVADPQTGELLFYFDGRVCRNSAHEVMPNGTNIMGQSYTTTQGSLIVPVIDSPGKYYLFTMLGSTGYGGFDPTGTEASGGDLFYAKIDMSLDGGMGDVVAKNVILDSDSLSESMIAVPGDNCDVWLLVHRYYHAEFRAYHITAAGIDPDPVVSLAGDQIERYLDTMGFKAVSYAIGGMAVSPDREKIAISSCNPYAVLFNMGAGYIPQGWIGVLLCSFDPATGVVSDAIQLEEHLTPYTLCFSPDNSKLYMVNLDLNTMEKHLDQYDVSVLDSLAMATSKVTIAPVPASDPLEGYFKLYNDTIYLCSNPLLSALSTITNPNAAGAACGFQLNAIDLAPGTATDIGLPADVVLPLPPDTLLTVVLDTTICHGWAEGVLLAPDNAGADFTYEWNDGSTDEALSVTHPGSYWLKYGNRCHFYVDTFKLNGMTLEPVITVDEFILSTTQPYDSYQWMLNGSLIAGATAGSFTVLENGDYQVIVTGGGCTDTSEVYTVTNGSGIAIPSAAAFIRVYPNPASHMLYVDAPVKVQLTITGIDGKVLKAIKSNQINLEGLAYGMYFVQILDEDGLLIKVEKFIKET